MSRLFTGTISVCYGQFYVVSPDGEPFELEPTFTGQQNGLCGAQLPGVLFLITGLHTGTVALTVDIWETEPPLAEDWEEVVEVSFQPRPSGTTLEEWGGDTVCELPLTEQHYRVRYCAKSFGLGEDTETQEDGTPVETYALAFWPAPPAPDRVLKQTREEAAYWHQHARSLG